MMISQSHGKASIELPKLDLRTQKMDVTRVHIRSVMARAGASAVM
jgi:hypothetical protein